MHVKEGAYALGTVPPGLDGKQAPTGRSRPGSSRGVRPSQPRVGA